MAGPALFSDGLLWLMSPIATTPRGLLITVLTRTLMVGTPLASSGESAGERYNWTVVPFSGLVTSKSGAGNCAELLSWVTRSLLFDPVSLPASRMGAPGVGGGIVATVIWEGFVVETEPLDASTKGSG